MRPQSIVMFERLFLASLALSAAGFVFNYGDVAETLTNDPGVRQLGIGNFVIGIAISGYALYLLLWYLIARQASKAAKWVLVVFTAFGALSALISLAGPWGSILLLSLAINALGIAAVVYLFQADAKAWLDGKPPADPATFD